MMLRVAPSAVQDLKDIRDYIGTELGSPAAARNTVRRIMDDYILLESMPFMGGSLSSRIGISTPYRYLVSGNYIVFYKVHGELVEICRILYGRRDYIKVLFGDISENEP